MFSISVLFTSFVVHRITTVAARWCWLINWLRYILMLLELLYWCFRMIIFCIGSLQLPVLHLIVELTNLISTLQMSLPFFLVSFYLFSRGSSIWHGLQTPPRTSRMQVRRNWHSILLQLFTILFAWHTHACIEHILTKLHSLLTAVVALASYSGQLVCCQGEVINNNITYHIYNN